MNIKEYLLTSDAISQAEIARRMWPNNKSAKTYLSRKLSGEGDRPWTDKDSQRAREVIAELIKELSEIEYHIQT